MAKNNHVQIIGNLGDAPSTYEKGDRLFVAFSIATRDSYKKGDEFIQKEPIWHRVLSFSPSSVEQAKPLKKGQRVKVSGSLSYRDFTVMSQDGKVSKKQEASIIASKIELAPLKSKDETPKPT